MNKLSKWCRRKNRFQPDVHERLDEVADEIDRLEKFIKDAPHDEECAAYVAYLQDLRRWQEGPQDFGTAPGFDEYAHACDCWKGGALLNE